ncbi:MAG: CsgG/HfaB family protein [Arenicella sp.]|nr:CsgG/HfaB family protein [Arenicella sp.]
MSRRLLAVLSLLTLLSSCVSTPDWLIQTKPAGMHTIKPVIAVTDFENRSNFAGRWELGEGMAEIMVAELLRTDKVVLLERKHIEDVLSEIGRQGRDLFRAEGKVERGRLKNAQYLVRGVVTDFSVTGDASGWFRTESRAGRFGGSRARVALTVYLTDIESGEIISSVFTDDKVSSWFLGGATNYKKTAFGGDAYFRTPLGKATQRGIRKAVGKILQELPIQRWRAQVAEGSSNLVIVNGGSNVGIQTGDLFEVHKAGRSITDPSTGNVIEQLPGRVVGRIRVQRVNSTSAHAVLVAGHASRGDFLEPVQ